MFKVDIVINRNLIPKITRTITQRLRNFPKEIHQQFVKTTPIDTGNARRRTRLVNNRTIYANYPYAQVLDKGRHVTNRGMRGSKQAPRGMSKPVKAWAQRRFRQILRKG
jgi:hypothetical protein